jgi:hypothetical protein
MTARTLTQTLTLTLAQTLSEGDAGKPTDRRGPG